MRISLPGYHKLISRLRDDGPRGGVGICIKENLNYIIREDISVFIPHVFESAFIEIQSPKKNRNTVLGVINRPNSESRADIDIFSCTMIDIMDTLNSENKNCVIMGDMTNDLLKFGSHTKTADYLDNLFSHGFLPLTTKPARLSNLSATLIDDIYTNDIYNKGHSGIITTDVADHFGIFYLSHGNIKQVKNQNKKIRIISEANMNKFKV